MTFNIGDRVRVVDRTDGTTTLGETGTVVTMTQDYLWIDWDPVDHPTVSGGWAPYRFEKIEEKGLTREDLDRLEAGVTRLRVLTPCTGHDEGRPQVSAGATGVYMGRCVTDSDRVSVSIDEGGIYHLPLSNLEVVEGVPEEVAEAETKGPTAPRTAAEWEALWERLSETANRIADEHGMCSQFEENVQDLGLPGRQTREANIEVTFRRMTPVQVTVYVPQYADYTVTAEVNASGDPIGDISDLIADVNEEDLYWRDIDSYDVADALSSITARDVDWEEGDDTTDFEYEDWEIAD